MGDRNPIIIHFEAKKVYRMSDLINGLADLCQLTNSPSSFSRYRFSQIKFNQMYIRKASPADRGSRRRKKANRHKKAVPQRQLLLLLLLPRCLPSFEPGELSQFSQRAAPSIGGGGETFLSRCTVDRGSLHC